MLLFIMITVVILGKNEADEQTLCYRLLSSALIKKLPVEHASYVMLCYDNGCHFSHWKELSRLQTVYYRLLSSAH